MANETFKKNKYHDYIVDVMKSRGQSGFDENVPESVAYYKRLEQELGSDLDYFDSIEQYKGTDYYDTLYSNPYLLGRSSGYSPTGLESLGDTLLNIGTFGIANSPFANSGQKRYFEDLKQKSNDFLSENIDKMRQEKYNSAPEQAERQRIAGLNPDLTGGVDAGSAAENDQPMQPPVMPNQSADVVQAAQIPFNLVNGIMSLYQSFQQSSSINLQNAAQEIANNNNAMNFVLDSLANSFIEANPSKEKPDLSDISTLLDASGKLDYSGFSRSTRKVINKFFGAYKDNVRNGKMPVGLEKRIAELRGIATRENWSAANIQSNPLYSDDFREMVISIYSKFGDLPNLVDQINMEAEYLEGNYQSEFYGSASGTIAASAENSTNELTKESNDHQKNLMKTMADIDKVFADVEQKLKDFANSGKRGSVFGLLGLLLIPTLKNQVYNGINISFPSLHINNSRRNVQNIKTDNRTYNRYK